MARNGTPKNSTGRRIVVGQDAEPVASPVKQPVPQTEKNSTEPTAAAERPIPTMGWRKWLYNLVQNFTNGKSTFVPKLSAKEQALLQQQAEELAAWEAAVAARLAEQEAAEAARLAEQERAAEERNECIDHIRNRFRRDHVNVIAAFCNQDGGQSKTWASVLLALVFAEYLRLPVIYIELRRGTDLGCELLGVDPDSTMSLREFHANVTVFNSGIDYLKRMSSNDKGVVGVKTDDEVPDVDPLDRQGAKVLVEAAAKEFAVVILDTANVPTDGINLGGLDAANVFVYPTKPGSRPMRMCRATAETLAKHVTSKHIGNRVFMVNALDTTQQAEDYRDRLGALHHEHVCGTHFDAAADYERMDNPVAQLEGLSQQTIDELLVTAKAIVDKAYEAQQAKAPDNIVTMPSHQTGTE